MRRADPLLALVLAVALAGCGQSDPTTGPGPSAAPPAGSSEPAPLPSPLVPTGTPTSAPDTPAARGCLGQDLEVLPTSERVVALTVDLGAGSQGLPAILQALAAQEVRATFFVTGGWVRGNPDGLSRILAAGHLVGNHTDSHPALPALSDAEVRAELAAVEGVVQEATGRSTRPLFRFPFGERDARTIALVNREGYCAYRWTVDTLGWQGTGDGGSAARVVQRVLDTLRPGQIVLMHGGAHPQDGSTLDADALPEVLRLLRERGYRFTTL